jgi:hypothetical protein
VLVALYFTLLQLHGSDKEVASFVLLHSILPESFDRMLWQLIALRVLSLCDKVIKSYNANIISH